MLEIGSSLAEARRRRRLELAEVEQATRIRIRHLQALEQERFELLPPDPYRRSFLCEYATFLGLDGDLYAQEYDLRFRVPQLQPPAPLEPAFAPAGRPRRRRLLLIAALILVVLVGVAAWQLVRRSGSETASTPAAPATPAQTHPQVSPSVTSRPRTRPAAPATLLLTAARGSCWLWIRVGSSSGQTIYEQTLQSGQSARFGLRRPLWIRLGAPWNLAATLGRRPLSLPAQTGDVLVSARGLQPECRPTAGTHPRGGSMTRSQAAGGGSASGIHQRRYPHRRLFIGLGQHMRVDIEGEGHRRVPQPARDDPRVDATAQGQGGVGMP